METLDKDTYDLWREEGRQLIQQNFEVFRRLVVQAKDYAQSGEYNLAAIYGEMAAFHATVKHSGLFVSLELEQVLNTVGRQAVPTNVHSRKPSSWRSTPKNILHVATSVMSIGGHSRMLWRWIQQDSERSHSLVLTRQASIEVPKTLRDAVRNSQGKIYVLDNNIGGIISWAKRLREIATAADLVVLHIHNYDVIPIIAFANQVQSPPIIFLDHADHLFWLGASISDVVVTLRASALQLVEARRNIEKQRHVLLPIVLESTQRVLSRVEAKRQLALPENCILLLSIARAIKYRTIDGISFADAHVPLLKQYKQAILIVIGPSDREDWSSASQQTQGRIRVFSETENTSVFYQAADIYVDSFPFVSNTSLLEAGSYGVPLVSRYPYSDACNILGADMPGLTGNLIRVRSLEEYTEVLSRLIEDEERRLCLGERTKRKIAETHWGNNWQHSLNEIYSHAVTVPRVTVTSDAIDRMFLGEPDVFIPRIHPTDIDSGKMIQCYLPMMPTGQRLCYWLSLVKKYGLHNNPVNLLLPEWFRLRYYSLRSRYNSYLCSFTPFKLLKDLVT